MGRKRKNTHVVNLDDPTEISKFIKIGQGILEKRHNDAVRAANERKARLKMIVPGSVLTMKSTDTEWDVIKIDDLTQAEKDRWLHVASVTMTKERTDRKMLILKSRKSGYTRRIQLSITLWNKYELTYVPKAAKVLYSQTHENGSESTQGEN